MALNILNNVINNIQNGQIRTEGNVTAGSDVMRQAATRMLDELRNLMPGDTISGKLVSKDGNNIGLLLSNNTMLNTVLDEDVNIGMGGQMSFEVKSNQNGQLTLRPMFTNLSNSTTIMNALDNAGIPASDTTIEMVDTLMRNNMSINKDMLTSINRELSMHPEADVKDIVMLHKMDIPVNDSTVNQMHLYNNNNQWMMDNISDSGAELTSLLTDVIAQGGEEAANIINGLQTLLEPMASENEIPAEGETMVQVQSEAPVENAQAQNANVIENSIKPEAELAVSKPADTNVSQPVVNGEEVPVKEAVVTEKPETAETVNDINKFNVFDKLKTMDKETISNPAVREQVKDSITELLKDNFLMNPKDIGEDKYVKKYYEKTIDLTEQLTKLLTENGKDDTAFAKTMTNVKENTNFMNQINELYNYVQLPLKMNDSQANGDLYVYARKKGRGMGGEDGKLTALLRLSMEHLGNMDIFLTLQDGQNLSTKFTLEKEEMIDFIEAHIDELNNRLIKKGYNIGTTTVGKSDSGSESVIDNIVKGDGGNILLSTQSFDARA